MHDMVDRMVKSLRKVKKARTPLPSFMVPLDAHYELLAPHEQETYDDLLNVQKYGGPEMDSEEEPNSLEARVPPPA